MGDDTSSCIIKIGPAGRGVPARGSYDTIDPWDDKGRQRIAQIFIWHGEEGINSIQFQYADHGPYQTGLVLSGRIGVADGTKFDVVKLGCPSEYITWIGGHTNYSGYLCSVTFGTNRKQYGPFGQVQPYSKEFNFQIGIGNQFDGFFGFYSKKIVTAIGLYLKAAS